VFKTRLAILLLAIIALAYSGRRLWSTPSSGSSSTLLGRGMITSDPAGNSGWHSHPGPVFVTVMSGTVTFCNSDAAVGAPLRIGQSDFPGLGALQKELA